MHAFWSDGKVVVELGSAGTFTLSRDDAERLGGMLINPKSAAKCKLCGEPEYEHSHNGNFCKMELTGFKIAYSMENRFTPENVIPI